MSLDILRSMGMSDEQIQEKLLETIATKFLQSAHPDVFDDEEDYELAFDDDPEDLDDEEIQERRKKVESLRKESSMNKLLGTHLRRHFESMFKGALAQLGTEFVMPIVKEMIGKKVFQKTNCWGEENGKSQTPMEFMEAQCKSYLLEEVNDKGQSKDEVGHYDRDRWKSAGQRIDALVKKECDARIRDVVRDASQASLNAVGEAYRDRITMAVTMAIDAVKIEVKK